jgi:hypothetical protein
MRTVLLAIVLPLALSMGCGQMYKQRVNQQLWEREMRLQEDCIYKLRWQLEDAQRQLDDANQRLNTSTKENGVLRDSVGPDLSAPSPFGGPSGSSGRSLDGRRLPPAPGLPNIDTGKEFIPGQSTPPGGSSAPSFDPSTPAPKPGGASLKLPELRSPGVAPASYNADLKTDLAGNPLRSSEKINPDADVARILLNPTRTGGLNSDGKAGDDMLSIVVEERSPGDEQILAPGDLSVVLVDPALEGREAKIGRWDFDSDEVSRHVRRNKQGGSFQFELPFQTKPAHSDLRVFVRFTTFDGRRLEANLPIEIDLGNRDTAGRWKLAPIAARTEEPTPAVAAPAVATQAVATESEPTEKRSVYQPSPGSEDDASAAEEPPPRETKRYRPGWSPSR